MTSPKAKTLARRLLRENLKNERSWRTIAREDFGGQVNYATLNRIALSRGEWLPKDIDLLCKLGLKRERVQRVAEYKAISDMATSALAKALKNRTEMPPVDPRIIKQFAKLGWLKKVKA